MNSMLPEAEKVKYPMNTSQNPMDLDEPVLLDKKAITPTFTLQIVAEHIKETFMMGHQLKIMVQPPYPEDMSLVKPSIFRICFFCVITYR